MNFIGKRILESRKIKGLTQEELAQLSKVNLRTIQRIENGESEPRGKTLSLLCDVLQIDVQELLGAGKPAKIVGSLSRLVDFVFLIILNLSLVFFIGFLTIDSEANLNSRVGAFLLSFLIPFFIVFFTRQMIPLERMFKFGGGFIIYLAVSIFIIGFPMTFVNGLVACIIISLSVLYFGNRLMPHGQ